MAVTKELNSKLICKIFSKYKIKRIRKFARTISSCWTLMDLLDIWETLGDLVENTDLSTVTTDIY